MVENLEPTIYVSVSYNGLDAVNQVREGTMFNLVFMDVNMPIMDGIEATKEIKQIDRNIQVVGLTGFTDTTIREQCIEAGMSKCFGKPLLRE